MRENKSYATEQSRLNEQQTQLPLVVYVDIDDTLVRTVGRKRIPISEAIDHVRALFAEGASLYCWSSGGGEYARLVAQELGLSNCFMAFLPKPQVMLDDQAFSEWRRLVSVHPLQCASETVVSYRAAIAGSRRPVA